VVYKGIGVRFVYIHGEVTTPPPPGTQLQMAMNIQVSGPPEVMEELVNVPFTITVSSIPPSISITIRGLLAIQATSDDVKRVSSQLKSGTVPPEVQAIITQYAVFEAGLVARELGIPPTIPFPWPSSNHSRGGLQQLFSNPTPNGGISLKTFRAALG